MTHRIPLSLSPTGNHATRPVRVSPALIEFHVARARQMRGALLACWMRRIWAALTRRRPAGKPCAESAWLAPATA
jgi:hypothetical protein